MQFFDYVAVPFDEQRRLIDDYSKTAKEELV
jgi:elongation factor G